MQGIFSVADEGCLSGGICWVAFWGIRWGGPFGENAGGVLPRVDVGYPSGSLSGFSVRGHQQGVLLVPYAGCPSGGRCHRSS